MDASDWFIICIVDWNDASRLMELISWQLFLPFFVHKFALIQVASVVVALSDIQINSLLTIQLSIINSLSVYAQK